MAMCGFVMSSIFPETYYNDSGTWRKLNQIYYNDSGTWRELREVYYNDNGTWRRVFTNEEIVITNRTATDSADTSGGPASATASYLLENDGQASLTIGGVLTDIDGEWYSQAPVAAFGSDYETRATVTFSNGNGSLSGSSTGNWIALNPGKQWDLSDSGDNVERIAIRDLFIEIRDGTTQEVLTSATITLRTFLFGP